MFFIIFLLNSCERNNELNWDIEGLYEVKSATSYSVSDSLIIEYEDNSYIYFNDYTKWKTDYFVFLNKENFEEDIEYKIIAKHKGFDDLKYYYKKSDIEEIVEIYDSNKMFHNISQDMFDFLSNTEILNLKYGNDALNKYKKDYEGELSDLFFEYSNCIDTCFANQRIEIIGGMLNEIKLDHYWVDDWKVEPCNLIDWLNSLSHDSLINIIPLDYCQQDLIGKSVKILSYIQEGDIGLVREEFYSNNTFNEISDVETILSLLSNELVNLNFDSKERIVVERLKSKVDSKYFKTDSIDLTRVNIPLFEEGNRESPSYVLMQSFTKKEGIFKLVGFYIYDPSGEEVSSDIISL